MKRLLLAAGLLSGCVATPEETGSIEVRMLRIACVAGDMSACAANERFALQREQAAMLQPSPDFAAPVPQYTFRQVN
ncbi:hypothetical protein [Palleronia sp. THAF1]|uniref:hypothetical protein n=1 Tax=Palleronia sp. THAF1 TaxID=2587842 RepID=UPI000F5461F7|nr:hypothetical protein [Palleronia sp. THAF1]